MRKAKKMPGTKTEHKYIGPMIAADVTDSHALVLKDGSDCQYKKVPLHISRQYFPRSKITKHKSNDDLQSVVVSKKFKVIGVKSSQYFFYKYDPKTFYNLGKYPRNSILHELAIRHFEGFYPQRIRRLQGQKCI